MSHASFSIAYIGPAVDAGVMDVRDLAPSLLALSQIFEEANKAINGREAKVALRLEATSKGSFVADLQLVTSITSQLTNLLNSDGVNAASNLIGFLGFLGVPGLFTVIKFLKGRKPDEVKKRSDGNVEIHFRSHHLIVPSEVLKLYADLRVREAAEFVVNPLRENNIDKIEVRHQGQTTFTIEKSEASDFTKPALEDEALEPAKSRFTFSIVSLAFKEDNKWRLYDGNTTVNALITDKEFLERVDRGETFSKNDLLVCEVTVLQTITAEGLKTEYQVTKVLEHRPGSRQLKLELD